MSLERYPPLAGAPAASAINDEFLLQIVIVPAIGSNGEGIWFPGHDTEFPNVPDLYCGIRKKVAFYRFHSLQETLQTNEGLDPYADEFLSILCSKDNELLTRGGPPIHFACHSTGGLVLKLALVKAHAKAQDKRAPDKKCVQLLEKSMSVAFFGVPHRGSSILANLEFRSEISRLLNLQPTPNPELFTQLEPGHPILGDINYKFLKLVAPECRKIWSFTEQLPTQLPSEDDTTPRMKKMIVDANSAVLQEEGSYIETPPEERINERIIALHSTHDKLVDGQHSIREINEYINDLRCLMDEAEFHVQISEFKPGHTDHQPKDPRSVPLHKFLKPRSGPNPYLPKPTKSGEMLRWINISCNNMAWVRDVLRTVSNAATSNGPYVDLTTAVLDEEVWKSKEHRPHHRSPHSRYMTPLFRAFLPDEKDNFKEKKKSSSDEERPKSISFLASPSNDSQMVLYIPYLHWDTAKCLARRGEVIECRNKVQYFQEKMSDIQSGSDEIQWGESIPNPYLSDVPMSSKTSDWHIRLCPPSPSSSKTKPGYIESRMDLEKKTGEYLDSLVSRHRLLYNFGITSRSWEGALHPMRSLQQYGCPFMENDYFRKTETEVEDEKKHKNQNRKWTNKGCPEVPSHKVGDEDARPQYAKDFEAKIPAILQQQKNRVGGKKSPQPKQITNKEAAQESKVLMVDQLWLWILNSYTVVTFFPSNYSGIKELESPGDLYHHILKKLTSHPRYPTRVYTVFDLMALIILMSSSIMLDTSQRHRAPSGYLDVFYRYERNITNNSWKDPDLAQGESGKALSKDEQIGKEGYIQLLNIQNELDILLQLLNEQLQVIDSIKEAHPWIHRQTGLVPDIHRDHNVAQHPFVETAEQRVLDYQHQVNILRAKCLSAIKMYTHLYNMIHTRKLLEEAESAHRSSDMLIVFTVITVIFAPLTFFAGLFGVAAVEWDVRHQNLELKAIMLIMFVASFVIIVIALVCAFGTHAKDRLQARSKLSDILKRVDGSKKVDTATQAATLATKESVDEAEATGAGERVSRFSLRRRGRHSEEGKEEV